MTFVFDLGLRGLFKLGFRVKVLGGDSEVEGLGFYFLGFTMVYGFRSSNFRNICSKVVEAFGMLIFCGCVLQGQFMSCGFRAKELMTQ